MPGSSRGRRGRSAVSTRDIDMRSAEEEMEFRRELERVIIAPPLPAATRKFAVSLFFSIRNNYLMVMMMKRQWSMVVVAGCGGC